MKLSLGFGVALAVVGVLFAIGSMVASSAKEKAYDENVALSINPDRTREVRQGSYNHMNPAPALPPVKGKKAAFIMTQN